MNAHNAPPDGVDDISLVEAVQRGELQAFELLVDRHLANVRTFLALRTPVSQLVDELAHETFVFAYHHVGEFRAGTSFRAWLLEIAWNLLRAEVQRFSRELSNQQRFAAECFSQGFNGEAAALPSREVEFLQECVEQIPAPMRELLTLKYHDERSTEEIAGRLQRSLAWVRTVLFRLRQQFRKCIEGKRKRGQPC